MFQGHTLSLELHLRCVVFICTNVEFVRWQESNAVFPVEWEGQAGYHLKVQLIILIQRL